MIIDVGAIKLYKQLEELNPEVEFDLVEFRKSPKKVIIGSYPLDCLQLPEGTTKKCSKIVDEENNISIRYVHDFDFFRTIPFEEMTLWEKFLDIFAIR